MDENGQKVANKVMALPPAHLTGGIEAPAGERTEGSFTRGVYTAEQQARLGVDENGTKLTSFNWLLETAFVNFDENKDGTVSCEEFCDFANTLGGLGHLSQAQVQIMIDSVDLNGDGILQMSEFKKLISTVLAENFGDIKGSDIWHQFFCDNFLTARQAREFVDKFGTKAPETKVQALPPAHLLGKMEAPMGVSFVVVLFFSLAKISQFDVLTLFCLYHLVSSCIKKNRRKTWEVGSVPFIPASSRCVWEWMKTARRSKIIYICGSSVGYTRMRRR